MLINVHLLVMKYMNIRMHGATIKIITVSHYLNHHQHVISFPMKHVLILREKRKICLYIST